MALPASLTLEIVTPDRSVVQADVDEVVVPGVEGCFGVLPGHTPMVAMLQAGPLWYRRGQARRYLAVAFGFAEVLPDRVTILAESAERAEEIDTARAEADLERARRRLARPTADIDLDRAHRAHDRAASRLRAASMARAT